MGHGFDDQGAKSAFNVRPGEKLYLAPQERVHIG